MRACRASSCSPPSREEQFAPDLALLVSLVADKSLTPHTGQEQNWRDIVRVAEELRDRRVGGKAVFRVEP